MSHPQRIRERTITKDVPECPSVIADLAFDSGLERSLIQTSAHIFTRRIILQTPAFQVDLRIRTVNARAAVAGQILERKTKNYLETVEVALLKEETFISGVTSPRLGVFEFSDLPHGSLNIIVTLPKYSSRIRGSFSI